MCALRGETWSETFPLHFVMLWCNVSEVFSELHKVQYIYIDTLSRHSLTIIQRFEDMKPTQILYN